MVFMKRTLNVFIFVALSLILWEAYENIRILRGTFLWEVRYVALGVFAFVLLSIAQIVWDKVMAEIALTREDASS